MALSWRLNLFLMALLAAALPAAAQDPAVSPEADSEVVTPSDDPAVEQAAQTTADRAEATVESAKETADAYADAVDKDPRAQEFSAGILNPIYQLAERMRFSWFHWIAFATMATGVVSFALQLTLGKLVVLMRMGLSLTEILGDALGLVVSLVGLVLTTQAATENSNFTHSPAAVLSAAITGVVLGILFYIWGQRAELQATEGRRVRAVIDETRPR